MVSSWDWVQRCGDRGVDASGDGLGKQGTDITKPELFTRRISSTEKCRAALAAG